MYPDLVPGLRSVYNAWKNYYKYRLGRPFRFIRNLFLCGCGNQDSLLEIHYHTSAGWNVSPQYRSGQEATTMGKGFIKVLGGSSPALLMFQHWWVFALSLPRIIHRGSVEYFGSFGCVYSLSKRARTNPCANLRFYARSSSNSDCACALRAPIWVRFLRCRTSFSPLPGIIRQKSLF